MSDTEVNDELTEEVRRKMLRRDELFRQWAERRKRWEEVEERRQTFANHFGVRPIKWSRQAHSVAQQDGRTTRAYSRTSRVARSVGHELCCGTPLDSLWWRLGPRRDVVEERTAMYWGRSSLGHPCCL